MAEISSCICGILRSSITTSDHAAHRWYRNIEQKGIQPRPSSPDNRVLQNADLESPSHIIRTTVLYAILSFSSKSGFYCCKLRVQRQMELSIIVYDSQTVIVRNIGLNVPTFLGRKSLQKLQIGNRATILESRFAARET